jgi:hypothetical protein
VEQIKGNITQLTYLVSLYQQRVEMGGIHEELIKVKVTFSVIWFSCTGSEWD